jgi:hypothetical protein
MQCEKNVFFSTGLPPMETCFNAVINPNPQNTQKKCSCSVKFQDHLFIGSYYTYFHAEFLYEINQNLKCSEIVQVVYDYGDIPKDINCDGTAASNHIITTYSTLFRDIQRLVFKSKTPTGSRYSIKYTGK